ncbi:MAG: PAS domain S-box protein [Burkholderiales bacterium]
MTQRDSSLGPPPTPPSGQLADEPFRLLVDSVTDYAIFLLDTGGHVASWNAGAQRIKGYLPSEIIGQSFERFYPAEKVAEGWPHEELQRARECGRFEDEGWRIRKDGSRFWASVVITALRDTQGRLQGFAKVTRDLTERRQQEEALRRSEEQLRLLLEAVRDYALIMLDTGGHVLTWNAGAEAIMGYKTDEVLLRHVQMFVDPAEAATDHAAQELDLALTEGRVEIEGQRMRKDGSLFWANVIITPVRGHDGMHRGFAVVTRDLSGPRRLLELEQTSRRMSEFIAMLAHELRNPLAPIRNAINVIQMQETMPAIVQRMSDVIDRQARHLTRLVDDLLDIGRIATGKISLRIAPIDYRDVVLTSVEAARPVMQARGHRLHVDVPEKIPMRADASRLAQVLQNLLINAARYTPQGGEVSLTVQVDGASCVTLVSDTGQGIAPASLEHVFELFVQEHGLRRDPSESGLGVGLTLARRMAEMHGGSLTAQSEGRGRGATFKLALPCLQSAPQSRDDTISTGARSESLRILVIDDNRDAADSMVILLQLMGHESDALYTAADALRHGPVFDPALVMMDLNMPDLSGFDLIDQLRKAITHPIYVAAVTGFGQQSDRERTRAAGFDAHLTKPVSQDQLQATIEHAATRLKRG